jgi:hypothetical protein
MTLATPDLPSQSQPTRPTLVDVPFDSEYDTEPYGLRGEPLPFEVIDSDEPTAGVDP